MGLIEDYKSLLSSIQTVADEIPDLQSQLDIYQQEIKSAQNKRSQLQMEFRHQSETLRNQRLQELTRDLQSEIAQKQSEVTSKLNALDSQYQKDKAAIQQDDYHSKLISKYALLDKANKTLENYRGHQEVPQELEQVVTTALAGHRKYSDAQIQKLITRVEQTSVSLGENLGDVKAEALTTIINFISFKSIFDTKFSDYAKFWAYLLYLAGLIALCVFVPSIPIVMLCATVCACFMAYNSSSRSLLDFILPFSELSDSKQYLEAQINSKVQKLRDNALQRLSEKYTSTVAPLSADLNALQQEYASAADKIRGSVSNGDLQSSIQQQYNSSLEDCDKRIRNAERQIKRTEIFIANDEKRLPELKERRVNMLMEIKEAYLNPKAAGTSKTLVKSFFLGIDDSKGGLIEFNYGGKATLIVYKGSTCRVNKDLLSMMLMQILSNMSLAVLDIHLVDLKSAGTDYAVFFQKTLADRMHMYATNEDVKRAIEYLHDTLILRTQEVLTEAESLEAYNERMLTNRSLPMEYVFFFLQDPTEDQMQDQLLQQILYNGPTVGIIPIVFVNHEELNYIGDISREEAEQLTSFYQSFDGSVFIFDGARSDLIPQNKILSSIMENIKKGIK